MRHVKKNDLVTVLRGKDRGKSGKVLKVFPQRGRAIVEGLQLVKKHVRRRRDDQQGGIVEMESTIHLSNLLPVCGRCKQPTRPGTKVLDDGSTVRVCRRCGEAL